MTGVEAVSNGVPAFKPPEAKNAAATMLMMVVLAITMFVGITLLAQAYHVMPSEHETVVSQLARGVFGSRGVPYYAVQAGTMLILVLAANTAYADFPRLASILARDRYLPRQLMNQGDRLAFSNGIVGLSVFAAILLVAFGGDTHALIPLYMIGVFVSFTLSQAGMVVHWRRLRGPGWQTSAAINGVGAFVTGDRPGRGRGHEGARGRVDHPAADSGSTCSSSARPAGTTTSVRAQLSLARLDAAGSATNIVLVPISGIHRAVVEALDYAKTLSSDVRAVYVGLDPQATERVKAQWPTWGQGVASSCSTRRIGR